MFLWSANLGALREVPLPIPYQPARPPPPPHPLLQSLSAMNFLLQMYRRSCFVYVFELDMLIIDLVKFNVL